MPTLMNQPTSKFAYALLFLMTFFSMGGPFLIGHVLKGGEHAGWPPDRPVEWVTFVAVTGIVIGLLMTILIYGLTFKRKLNRLMAERRESTGQGEPL